MFSFAALAMGRTGVVAVLASAILAASLTVAPARAEAQCPPGDELCSRVTPDGKGIVGLGLIGAELGFVIPALVQEAAGTNEWWPYLVFPVVGAAALAVMLRSHPAVRSVRYPGLPEDPAHELAATQMRRFGGLVSIELADAAAVHALVERSTLLIASTSFGGIHTSVDRRARWGDPVPAGFARISAGIEDTDDLIKDLQRALGPGATTPSR